MRHNKRVYFLRSRRQQLSNLKYNNRFNLQNDCAFSTTTVICKTESIMTGMDPARFPRNQNINAKQIVALTVLYKA